MNKKYEVNGKVFESEEDYLNYVMTMDTAEYKEYSKEKTKTQGFGKFIRDSEEKNNNNK